MAVVVAQLVGHLLPIPEVRSSNPVIGKIYIEHCLLSTVLKKMKIKKKEAGNGPFKKRYKSCIRYHISYMRYHISYMRYNISWIS